MLSKGENVAFRGSSTVCIRFYVLLSFICPSFSLCNQPEQCREEAGHSREPIGVSQGIPVLEHSAAHGVHGQATVKELPRASASRTSRPPEQQDPQSPGRNPLAQQYRCCRGGNQPCCRGRKYGGACKQRWWKTRKFFRARELEEKQGRALGVGYQCRRILLLREKAQLVACEKAER